MTTRDAAQPAGAEIVEVRLGGGAACVGEWRPAEGAECGVLLLHDEGADLDAMRPLARALGSAGVSAFIVDLPGHGLSGGAYAADGAALVEGAVAAIRQRGAVDLAVVAHGASVGLAHAARVDAAIGAVWVDGRVDAAPPADSPWRRVPTVVFSDPGDPTLTASADALVGAMNAWALRVDLHPDASTPRLANPTILSTSARFLHEQAGYRANARRQGGRAHVRSYPADQPRAADG